MKSNRKQRKEKQQKKSLGILVALLALCFIFVGIGAMTEDDKSTANTQASISSSVDETQESATPIEAGEPEGTEKETEEPNTPEPIKETTAAATETEPLQTSEPEVLFTPAEAAVDLSSIPAFSGAAYIAINDNIPGFSLADITTASFETYSSLDSLGRCGVAYSNIGTDLMPTEERGAIGQVKPSGWHTVKYDCVNGKYLYNRCHLIGYQLTAENANTKNLITGTRYLNMEGMLPFENMVADYIKETGNHVLYRVTPIFEGENLVASGVQMEAMSVEDNGDGILFNVYCYNAQPGVGIDYSSGDSWLEEDAAASEGIILIKFNCIKNSFS